MRLLKLILESQRQKRSSPRRSCFPTSGESLPNEVDKMLEKAKEATRQGITPCRICEVADDMVISWMETHRGRACEGGLQSYLRNG